MPEEAHYCLQCMTPCTPAQPSTAYLKSCAEHSQKRINRKQISSVLAAMILLVVLIPSVLAAPLHQQNAITAEGALTGTVQAAETETEAQPKTLLGKVKKAAKKAEQKIQSATGKMKEAVGIAPTAEEKQAMVNEAAEQAAQQAERDNRSTGNRGNTGNTNHAGKHRQRARHHRHHSPVHKRHRQARQHNHDHHQTCNPAGKHSPAQAGI